MKIIETANLTPASIARMGQTEKDWIYNGLDCCLTHEIDEELESVIDPIARGTYQMSLALQAPILEMNMRGILIDLKARDIAVKALEQDQSQVDHQFDYLCRNIFAREVNANSPVQVKELFYNWLGLPEQKKRNAKGEYAPSADRDTLEKLAGIYYTAKPFVSHILASRDIGKQLSTLLTPLSPTGRFHTSLSIAGTKTGRLASSMADFSYGSNMQNLDKRIRPMFVADPGYKMCNVDLEQADARNVGAQTWNLFPEYGEANRFLDFAESGDLHTAVCRMCWTELPWTEDRKANREIADQPAYREKSYRDLAKVLGHGSNFNGQPPQMSKHSKVDQSFVSDFQTRYFGAFPEVKKRIEWVGNELVTKGQLTTLFGRRRFFLKRRGDNKTLNEGCAFDPQSMTADEINNVMLRVYSFVKARFPELQMLLQVHDSLVFQYPEYLEDQIIPWLREAFRVSLTIRGGRQFIVPSEFAVGWNMGYPEYDKVTKQIVGNPNGLMKYKGTDSRQRV